MTISDVIAARRSVRAYTDAPVTADQIRRLLDAAVQAPTAMHDEPWQFIVIQNRALLRRYSDAAKALLLEQHHVYRDLHDPQLATTHRGFLDALKHPDFNVFYDAGTLIAIAATGTSPFVIADCWLAAENLMLAARDLELGTCCIGSALPALNSVETKRELGLGFDVSVVAPIVVGVPVKWPPASGRKAPVILDWVTREIAAAPAATKPPGSEWPD